MKGVAVVTVLALAACGKDPILVQAERAGGEKAADAGPGRPPDPQPGVPGQPAPGVGQPGAPGAAGAPPPGAAGPQAPGIPEEPAPGVPDQPPPGGEAGSAVAPQGPSVTLSGTVTYAAWKTGKIQLTAFDGDHAARAGGHPKVIGFGTIDAPGAFTISVPQAAGKVYLEASVDEDGDGRPGPQDPQGKADRFPVTVEDEAVTGLELVLTKREPPPGGGRE